MKAFLQSPVGLIEIKETDGYISSVRIIHEEEAEESEASPLLNNAIKQLEELMVDSKLTNLEIFLRIHHSF